LSVAERRLEGVVLRIRIALALLIRGSVGIAQQTGRTRRGLSGAGR